MVERKEKVGYGQWNSTYFGIYFKNFGHIPKAAIRLEKCVITIFGAYGQKAKVSYVCVCVVDMKEREGVCICVWQQQELKYVIFVLFQNLLCRNLTNFAPKLSVSLKKKKDELRMVVWARGTGLAKRFIVHCPYVSGYKSAITSQAAHEFRLTFCVANLTGKLRTLMNFFCMDAYCIH